MSYKNLETGKLYPKSFMHGKARSVTVSNTDGKIQYDLVADDEIETMQRVTGSMLYVITNAVDDTDEFKILTESQRDDIKRALQSFKREVTDAIPKRDFYEKAFGGVEDCDWFTMLKEYFNFMALIYTHSMAMRIKERLFPNYQQNTTIEAFLKTKRGNQEESRRRWFLVLKPFIKLLIKYCDSIEYADMGYLLNYNYIVETCNICTYREVIIKRYRSGVWSCNGALQAKRSLKDQNGLSNLPLSKNFRPYSQGIWVGFLKMLSKYSDFTMYAPPLRKVYKPLDSESTETVNRILNVENQTDYFDWQLSKDSVRFTNLYAIRTSLSSKIRALNIRLDRRSTKDQLRIKLRGDSQMESKEEKTSDDEYDGRGDLEAKIEQLRQQLDLVNEDLQELDVKRG